MARLGACHGLPCCTVSAGSLPALPVQTVNQIYWTQEVEEAFEAMAAGDKGALKAGWLVGVGSSRKSCIHGSP